MRRLLAVTLALALAGCGSSSTGPTDNNLVGTYQLQTVNGAPLPYTMPNGDQLVGGGILVHGDGTYIAGEQLQFPGGFKTDSVGGNWSGNGNSGSFDNWWDGSAASGSLRGSVLTITGSNVAWGYQKQ